MKKEKRIMNVIGQVDEKYIEEAAPKKEAKKKLIGFKWTKIAACACLLLVLPLTAFVVDIIQYGEDLLKAVTPISGDVAPMVYVNDKLYQIVDDPTDLTDSNLIFLGEIESRVPSSQEPKENFQTNDDIVGAKVYQYNRDIVALFNGKYYLYLYKNRENTSNETVEFDGQLFSKSDLSEETLEWLKWYNSLSPEEQLAVSSIPADLNTYDGSGTSEADANSSN